MLRLRVRVPACLQWGSQLIRWPDWQTTQSRISSHEVTPYTWMTEGFGHPPFYKGVCTFPRPSPARSPGRCAIPLLAHDQTERLKFDKTWSLPWEWSMSTISRAYRATLVSSCILHLELWPPPSALILRGQWLITGFFGCSHCILSTRHERIIAGHGCNLSRSSSAA